MKELSTVEQKQIAEISIEIDAITGLPGSYGAILQAIDRMTAEAFAIPPEYFDATEKAGSRASLDTSGHRPRRCAPK